MKSEIIAPSIRIAELLDQLKLKSSKPYFS